MLHHTYIRVTLFSLAIDCTIPCYCYHYTDATTTAVRTAVMLHTEITLLFVVVVSTWFGFVFFSRLRVDAGICI